jgi:hypothetical protein
MAQGAISQLSDEIQMVQKSRDSLDGLFHDMTSTYPQGP